MHKFAGSINPESIILIRGTVQKSPEEIKRTTIKDAEILIAEVKRKLGYHNRLFSFRSGSSQNLPLYCHSKSKMRSDRRPKKNRVSLKRQRRQRRRPAPSRPLIQKRRNLLESPFLLASTTESSICALPHHRLSSASRVEHVACFASFSCPKTLSKSILQNFLPLHPRVVLMFSKSHTLIVRHTLLNLRSYTNRC